MLNMDEHTEEEPEIEGAAKEEAISAKEKPSILESIKVYGEKSRQIYGEKPEPEGIEKRAEISI